MKKVFFLMPLLLLFVIKSYGQVDRERYLLSLVSPSEQNLRGSFKETDTIPKVVYKDLVEISDVKYIIKGKDYAAETSATLEIPSTSVTSAKVNGKNRSVGIELTTELKPKLISLIAFKNKYTNVISNRIIFKIDDKMVQNNPEEVLIDESNIMLVTVSPIKFVGDLEDLYMITLIPRSEKNIKILNSVRIL